MQTDMVTVLFFTFYCASVLAFLVQCPDFITLISGAFITIPVTLAGICVLSIITAATFNAGGWLGIILGLIFYVLFSVFIVALGFMNHLISSASHSNFGANIPFIFVVWVYFNVNFLSCL